MVFRVIYHLCCCFALSVLASSSSVPTTQRPRLHLQPGRDRRPLRPLRRAHSQPLTPPPSEVWSDTSFSIPHFSLTSFFPWQRKEKQENQRLTDTSALGAHAEVRQKKRLNVLKNRRGWNILFSFSKGGGEKSNIFLESRVQRIMLVYQLSHRFEWVCAWCVCACEFAFVLIYISRKQKKCI